MDEKNVQRRQIIKEKVQAERVELFVADYVKHKYKNIYVEATQYYNMLRQQNPCKIDLKKTNQYRHWAKQQVDHDEHPQQVDHDKHPQQVDHDKHPQQVDHGEHPQQVDGDERCFRDNLQLKISLMDSASIQKKPTATVETLTLETLTKETLAEGNIEPSLEEEIPAELIEEIIKELRQYPELQNIFATVEEQIAFEELGMDIEINDDDLLEKELW